MYVYMCIHIYDYMYVYIIEYSTIEKSEIMHFAGKMDGTGSNHNY